MRTPFGASRWVVGALIGCLATATALAVAVALHPGPLPGELGLVRRAQRLGEPARWLASVVRLATGTEACLVAALPVAAWRVQRDGRAVAPAIAITLAAMVVAQPVTKQVIDRPRPSEELVDVRASTTSESFPSGHSLSTAATWGAASVYAWRTGRRREAALLAAPVGLTGVASTVEGTHWPSDALAGTLLGTIAAWLAATLLIGARSRANGVSRGGRPR